MWQDAVITGTQLVLLLSFLPTVFHPTHKPVFSTCLVTTLCLFSFAFVYFTLEFWFATITGGALAALWSIVTVQRYRLNKKEQQ